MNAARDGGRLATPGRTLRSTDKFQQVQNTLLKLDGMRNKDTWRIVWFRPPWCKRKCHKSASKTSYNTVTFCRNDQMLFLFMRYYTAISTRRLCTIQMYRHTHTQVGRRELAREWRVETDREIKEGLC
jgi:hypothetical protein